MPGYVSFTTTSFSWQGERAANGVIVGGRRGVHAAAEHVRTRALPRTPLDRGPLRESATVQDSTSKLNPASSVVYDTPYAVKQHEDASLNHSEGEDHFLSKTVADERATAMALIAQSVRSGIVSGA